MNDIRAEIVVRRKKRLLEEGHAQGLTLPEKRDVPLVPFSSEAMPICEIKRRSPSKGDISPSIHPVLQAGMYRDAGIGRISVLTEQDYFAGSLNDLIEIKKAYPEISVLRKDFLLDIDDVIVSYRAGADAVLLIASILDSRELTLMYEVALRLGMECLVELHDADDIEKVRSFSPVLVGINARNLSSFKVEKLLPLKLRPLIDWPCAVVYESGIENYHDAAFVSGSGFQGALVGEGVMKDSSLPKVLVHVFGAGRKDAVSKYGFWKKVYDRKKPGRPLVKICGITRVEDAKTALGLGADLLGFVFANSPRKIRPGEMEAFREIRIPKVGVVSLAAGENLDPGIWELIRDGLLDAIQFHGSETPEQIEKYPGYKAFAVRDAPSVSMVHRYPFPAVLVDAYAPDLSGGTGKRIDPELVDAISSHRELWLAGGLNPENIRGIVTRHKPDLVDASSGLETSPGIKDPRKLELYFKEIRHALH